MLGLFYFTVCITATLFAIPSVVLFVEMVSALFLPDKKYPIDKNIDHSKIHFFVLIPAHNEELVIGDTLDSLIDKMHTHSNILVVADNCSDSTEMIAKSKGVQVIARHSRDCFGKGYALDFGIKYLDKFDVDAVLIFDADCTFMEGGIEHLISLSCSYNLPVQGRYLMESAGDLASVKSKISEFAFLIKNHVRPKGLKNLGLPCLLTGSGMLIPFKLLKKSRVATGNIVEDMQLGIDFVKQDLGAIYCDRVKIVSRLPKSKTSMKAQKARWEHGHFNMIKKFVPDLIKKSILKKSITLLVSALDLGVPPLSFYFCMLFVLLVAGVCFLVVAESLILFVLLSYPFLLLLTSFALGCLGFGTKIINVKLILGIPLYILWKMPLYISYVLKPVVTWNKTKR